MSGLIKRLQNDHALLVEALDEVKRLGIGVQDGRDRLFSLKSTLLGHLNVEDAQLYPPLRAEAEKNQALKRTLDVFARDMETVSKDVFLFFDKYSNGGSGMQFAKDFGHLYALLSHRISKEENILYPEYEKLNQ